MYTAVRFLFLCAIWAAILCSSADAAYTDLYSEAVLADNPIAWWRLGDDFGSATAAEEIAGYTGAAGQDVVFGARGAIADRNDTWLKVDVPGSPSGWRLETSADTIAPDIELPVNASGNYAVYIGVYMPDTLTSGLLVSDDADPYFSFIRGQSDGNYPAYHETLYKVMDVTDRTLTFRQPAEARSYITHVRLEPRYEVPEMPVATREVIGLADTWHWYYFFSSREPDCIDTLINIHEQNGFTELSMEGGRSCMTYNTDVGTVYRYDAVRPRTKWLRYHAENHQPFERAVAAADDLGVTLGARLCMGMHYQGIYRGTATSDFANDHPEYREKNRDGTVIPTQLCYGYQAVRDERVGLFREMVEKGADTVSLDCMIYSPMASWGDPYVQGFQSQYGVNPRTLYSDDALWDEWLNYRASSFTQLLREIDTMLQDVGRPEVKVSMRVSDKGLLDSLNAGINIEELVSEGLVDRIILGGDSPDRYIADNIIQEYKQALDGTSVKLIACLRTHGWPPMPGPEHHSDGQWPTAMYYAPDAAWLAQNVDHMYDLGVDGVAFYESDRGCVYPELKDFLIACRSPETIKEYVANLTAGTTSGTNDDIYLTDVNAFQSSSSITSPMDSAAIFESTVDGKIIVNDDAGGLDGAMDFGTDGDFSIEGWFKRPSGGAETGGIVNKGDTYASFWVLSWASGELGFLLDYGTGSTDFDLAKSVLTFNDDRWHYFVAVADRDEAIRLYVDGVLVAEDSDLVGGDISSDLPFVIGNLGTLSMNGSIDEIAVYGRVLTLEEIQMHQAAAEVPEPAVPAMVLTAAVMMFLIRCFSRKREA